MATFHLAVTSSVECKPSKGRPQEQNLFPEVFITLLESTPGETVTLALLMEDPRTADLSAVPIDEQYVFRAGENSNLSLGDSGLIVNVLFLGWSEDEAQEAILETSASRYVQFYAHRGQSLP